MIKRKNRFIKFISFIFQTEKIKHIFRLYEHIITNPVLITAVIFVIALFFVTGFTIYSKFYNFGFIRDLMVEAHGVVFDIFMLGVVIFWLQQKGRDKVEKKRYQDEIDDFRGWESEEACRRIRGNLRRLNNYGVTSVDISNCYLKNMDLRHSDFSGCYAWGANLSWTDLRFSRLVKGNFEDADLSFSDLSGSDIREAYFWKADLSNCNIRNSNMKNCIMLETNITDSDLTESVINNSSFANSNLTNSVFWKADLTHTDFDSADLTNCDFQSADLTNTIGLKPDQLLSVYSLYKAILPQEFINFINKNKPSLLEEPEENKITEF
ncbi:MAG: pentapeptide repeat-containing protein [Thermodesulfobacteriota bacterium]